MMSCNLLLKLPHEWQVKMHNEIASKLKLCIPDIELSRNVANETWRYISQDNFDKNELSLKLKPFLGDHASDFTEWVVDFAQKTLEYFIETVSNRPKMDETTIMAQNLQNELTNEHLKKENKSKMIKNQIKDNLTQNTYTQKTVDPLDETLDSLILKEKIAKLQGQHNLGLGVQTKSGKFNQQNEQEVNHLKKSRSKTFYKNLTLVNVEQSTQTVNPEQQRPVAKVPKLCMNFPNCQYGENCRYIHPTNKICKNWPNCFFGEKCAFIHPNK